MDDTSTVFEMIIVFNGTEGGPVESHQLVEWGLS